MREKSIVPPGGGRSAASGLVPGERERMILPFGRNAAPSESVTSTKNVTAFAPGSIAGVKRARTTPAEQVAFVCHQTLPMPFVCQRKLAVAVWVMGWP